MKKCPPLSASILGTVLGSIALLSCTESSSTSVTAVPTGLAVEPAKVEELQRIARTTEYVTVLESDSNGRLAYTHTAAGERFDWAYTEDGMIFVTSAYYWADGSTMTCLWNTDEDVSIRDDDISVICDGSETLFEVEREILHQTLTLGPERSFEMELSEGERAICFGRGSVGSSVDVCLKETGELYSLDYSRDILDASFSGTATAISSNVDGLMEPFIAGATGPTAVRRTLALQDLPVPPELLSPG